MWKDLNIILKKYSVIEITYNVIYIYNTLIQIFLQYFLCIFMCFRFVKIYILYNIFIIDMFIVHTFIQVLIIYYRDDDAYDKCVDI